MPTKFVINKVHESLPEKLSIVVAICQPVRLRTVAVLHPLQAAVARKKLPLSPGDLRSLRPHADSGDTCELQEFAALACFVALDETSRLRAEPSAVCDRAKAGLNTVVIEPMTAAALAENDPNNKIAIWACGAGPASGIRALANPFHQSRIKTMSLSMRLAEHVRACFSGLWIQSWEHQDALAEIGGLCRQEGWRLAVWSIDRGLSTIVGQADDQAAIASADPLAAIRAVSTMAGQDTPALLVLVNFHRFLSSIELVQTLASQVVAGKQNRTFLIILSPLVQLPIELEKLFAVLEHDLPDRQQLGQIAQDVATEPGELPDEQGLAAILDASAGLTRYEAENAFALSLVRHGRLAADEIWQLKAGMLKKSGLLRLHDGGERFAELGGLDAVKDFCLRSMRAQPDRDPRKRPRGILLLGVPGTGKSCFAKALGYETSRPTLVLDVGALMGSLVGQSEAQTRQALKIVDAMAPAVLFIDEVEKALSGASSHAVADSGVSARMFGSLLTWLADHESDVYVVCTANDVSRLPPEFVRAERFDAIWFLDLPAAQQRRTIWRMYLEYYGLDINQPRPIDADFTGAEIKACCRLSALLDCSLVEAAKNVVPVARTAAETVERLRGWAEGRCLAADQGGIYRRQADTKAKGGRKVSRDPSQN